MLQKLRQFMVGRYGADQLGFALAIFSCVLSFILGFFRNPYLRFIAIIPIGYMIFRIISKDTAKRYGENQIFLKYWNPIYSKIRTEIEHFKDKGHKYYPCPCCKKTLRVPKGRGKIEISCPYCKTKFKKRT